MKRYLVIAAAATAVAVAVSVNPASGASVAAPAPALLKSEVVTSASATPAGISLGYWTEARLDAARPAPQPVPSRSSTARTSDAVPGPAKAVSSTGVVTTKPAFGPPAPVSFAYPYPYTRFNVYPSSLWKAAPWRVNGKLFFVQNGGTYVCSATSVAAPSGTRVWTAGHCVSDGSSTFNTSAIFIPAYNGNATTLATQRPYGTFAATSYSTTAPWHYSYDLTRDLGAFTVAKNAAGQTLRTAVGTAGFAYNQNPIQQFQDDAYPQAAPFNGRNLVECQAATAKRDTDIAGVGPDPLGIGCDMTGGSSGGSWRIKAGGSSVGYINSHNDYKYTFPAQPLSMYGPYFDSLANSVRCAGQTPGSYGC